MVYFEYGKIDKRYWTGEDLLDQITNKAFSIMKELYPEYELLFIFNNIINNSIYVKNAVQVAYMNKKRGGQ